jgi:hypothetical protein
MFIHVHPPGNIRAWRTMVERHREEKSADSSTRALRKSYQQSHLVTQLEGMAKEIMNFCHTKYLLHVSKGSLTCRKSYNMGPMALFPLRRKACCVFVSPLKIHRPRQGLNPRTRNHANHYATENDSVFEPKEKPLQ